MRVDNYLIAMLNLGVVDVTVPVPLLGRRHFMPALLEHIVSFALVRVFFTESSNGGRHGLLNSRVAKLSPNEFAVRLHRYFVILGLVTLVLSPVMFVFYACYVVYQKAEELRTSPSRIGLRSWVRFARWRLRLVNEMPHFLDERLTSAHTPAVAYINGFSFELINVVMRCVSVRS